MLGRVGTEDARQALITALTGKDKDLAAAAAGALGQMAMNDTTKAALLAAARDNHRRQGQRHAAADQAGAPEGMRLAEEILNSKDQTGRELGRVAARERRHAGSQSASSTARSTRRIRA